MVAVGVAALTVREAVVQVVVVPAVGPVVEVAGLPAVGSVAEFGLRRIHLVAVSVRDRVCIGPHL